MTSVSTRLSLNPVRWTLDGHTQPRPFEPGKTHAMVVELYPPILFIGPTVRCLNPMLGPPLSDSTTPAPLRLMISETTYGTMYSGNRERLTRGAYDIADLYRGVLSEGLAPCPVPH